VEVAVRVDARQPASRWSEHAGHDPATVPRFRSGIAWFDQGWGGWLWHAGLFNAERDGVASPESDS